MRMLHLVISSPTATTAHLIDIAWIFNEENLQNTQFNKNLSLGF
jgi:hypothetical protein